MAMSEPMERVPGTDVWHRSVVAPRGVTTVYQYLVGDPFSGADPSQAARLLAESRDRCHADPYNPRRLFPQSAIIAGASEVPETRWDSVLELPGLEPAPWFACDAPPLTEHRLASAELGNERLVHVYEPPGPGPHPLVILLDGEAWLSVARLHAGLHRLMTIGALPPAVVAYVDNALGDVAARRREFACEPATTRMLADELLPLLRSRHGVSGEVVLGGCSLGGLAAAFAAYERPDVFGAVLSVSGSHWWGHLPESGGGTGRDEEPEWLTRQYAAAPYRPVRFWIGVGRLETGMTPLSPGVDQRAANRHFRTVLRAKGYDVTYAESPGGHDFASFRRGAVTGLRALLA
jgi:enterochelin esterase-like enzyme